MRSTVVRKIDSYCEACDKKVLSRVISGIEVKGLFQMPICLCKSCGVIDLDLMQFCREMTIGCNDN